MRNVSDSCCQILMSRGFCPTTLLLCRSNMLQYTGRLRLFSPKEIINLLGFPRHHTFPKSFGLKNNYKLAGNSLNVQVVARLFQFLLPPIIRPGNCQGRQ